MSKNAKVLSFSCLLMLVAVSFLLAAPSGRITGYILDNQSEDLMLVVLIFAQGEGLALGDLYQSAPQRTGLVPIVIARQLQQHPPPVHPKPVALQLDEHRHFARLAYVDLLQEAKPPRLLSQDLGPQLTPYAVRAQNASNRQELGLRYTLSRI